MDPTRKKEKRKIWIEEIQTILRERETEEKPLDGQAVVEDENSITHVLFVSRKCVNITHYCGSLLLEETEIYKYPRGFRSYRVLSKTFVTDSN